MKKKKGFLIICITMITIVSFSYIVLAMSAEPGSPEDPIVTKNYVEKRNAQLKFYIEESIKNLEERLNLVDNNVSINSQTAPVYEVVNVPQGTRLILGASAEIIFRAGKANVIQSASGGLSDVTIGRDLNGNESVPLNHLLITPRDDGRGASAITDCIFMVKGSYHIE